MFGTSRDIVPCPRVLQGFDVDAHDRSRQDPADLVPRRPAQDREQPARCARPGRACTDTKRCRPAALLCSAWKWTWSLMPLEDGHDLVDLVVGQPLVQQTDTESRSNPTPSTGCSRRPPGAMIGSSLTNRSARLRPRPTTTPAEVQTSVSRCFPSATSTIDRCFCPRAAAGHQPLHSAPTRVRR